MEKGGAYVKTENRRKGIVILNPFDNELKFTLPFPLMSKKITDLFKKQEYMMASDELFALIKPYDASILRFSDDSNAISD